MVPRRWWVCLLGLLCWSAPLFAFRFSIPEGWTELSRESPPASLEGVPSELVAEARSGRFVVLAIDLAGAADGFGENFNAGVIQRAYVASEASSLEIEQAIVQQWARVGATARVLERSLVAIDGVPSSRFVVDIEAPPAAGGRLRQLQYYVPGGSSTAVLIYTARPETFGRYLPVFEASAARTTGAAEAPAARRVGSWLAGSPLPLVVLLGAAAGALTVVLLTWLWRRRRR